MHNRQTQTQQDHILEPVYNKRNKLTKMDHCGMFWGKFWEGFKMTSEIQEDILLWNEKKLFQSKTNKIII